MNNALIDRITLLEAQAKFHAAESLAFRVFVEALIIANKDIEMPATTEANQLLKDSLSNQVTDDQQRTAAEVLDSLLHFRRLRGS